MIEAERAKGGAERSGSRTHLTVTVGVSPAAGLRHAPGSSSASSRQDALHKRIPSWLDLWRSLGLSSQLFLLCSALYALLGTTLAGVQAGRADAAHLQDTLVVLCSALFFLYISLHAFLYQNAYEILVCIGLAALNSVQLVVFGATLPGGGDSSAVGLVAACVLLQATAAALGRYAHRDFGWHMYSKLGCDLRQGDAEPCRRALCRMDLFAALAKLDLQVLLSLFLVSLSNGINPGSPAGTLPVLLAATPVGLLVACAWLLASTLAVRRQWQRWALGAEFSVPLCQVLPLLVMFEGLSQRNSLGQSHGLAYLLLYSLLFLCTHTAMWVDLRLLSRDFATLRKARARLCGPANGGGSGEGATAAGAAAGVPDLPLDILPLVHGAWLRKLPSGASGGCVPAGNSCVPAGPGGGKWRFFQLSHDGSTLRWSWRKFVLLYHVEDLVCCEDELTITLSLLLDPDLRLQFPDQPLYDSWKRGLRLLLRLLTDPHGLQGARPGAGPRDLVLQLGRGREGSLSSSGNSSPSRMLRRLRASSRRACETELTREQLQLAAQHARSMLSAAQGGAAQGALEAAKRPSSSGDDVTRRRSSFSDPAELPSGDRAHSPPGVQPAAAKRKGKRFAWLRRTMTLPTHLLFRSNSSLTSPNGSPSKQRLTEHAEQASDSSDGSFDQRAQQRLSHEGGSARGGGAGGAGGGSSSADYQSRRFRSLDFDRVPQAVTAAAAQPAQSGAGGVMPPPLPSPFTEAYDQGPESAGSAGSSGGSGLAGDPGSSRHSVHSRGSGSTGAASLPSLRAFPDRGGRVSLDAAASVSPTLAQQDGALTFRDALYWPSQQQEGEAAGSGGAAGTAPVPGQLDPAQQAQHQRVVSISVAGLPPSSGGEEPGRPHHRTDSGGGFVFLTGADSWAATPSRLAPPGTHPPLPPSLHLFQQQQQSASAPGPLVAAPEPSASSTGHQAVQQPAAQPSGGAGPWPGPSRSSLERGSAPMAPGRSFLLPGLPGAAVAAATAASRSAPSSGNPSPRSGAAQAGAGGCAVNPGAAAAASTTLLQQQGRASSFTQGAGQALLGRGSYRASSGTLGSLSLLPQGSGMSALWRGDSDTLSSWGLPTPTSARTTATMGGLSRFNSLGALPPGVHLPFGTAGAQGQAESGAVQATGVQAQWVATRLASLSTFQANGSGTSSTEWGGTANASPDQTPMSALRALGVNVPVEVIEYEDLVFGRLLGEGSEGSVYAAWYMETPVAVKKTQSMVEVEMCLHAGSHDNIVGLRGLCQHGGHIYLVMELCGRGTLDLLVHHTSSHKLEPLKLLPIVRSVARGMLHLHTRRPPILHRDLKPGNLFIGAGYVVKIGDFGMSRYAGAARGGGQRPALERTLTPGVIGTAAYCAPEVLNPDSPASAEASEDTERMLKADVYSFGVTLWEIIERKRPFRDMDGFQIQTQWFLEPESMRLPPITIPDNLTPQGLQVMQTLAGLVQSCTEWDPARRPSFKAILATLRSATGARAGDESTQPPTPAGSVVNPF